MKTNSNWKNLLTIQHKKMYCGLWTAGADKQVFSAQSLVNGSLTIGQVDVI